MGRIILGAVAEAVVAAAAVFVHAAGGDAIRSSLLAHDPDKPPA